jgi:hypothetical protein
MALRTFTKRTFTTKVSETYLKVFIKLYGMSILLSNGYALYSHKYFCINIVNFIFRRNQVIEK